MVILTQLEEWQGDAKPVGRMRKWLVRLGFAALVAGVVWASPLTTEAAQAQAPSIHVVRPGENLTRIAAQYGLSYQQLASFNGIRNPNHLRVGQQLQIPVGAPQSQPTSVRSANLSARSIAPASPQSVTPPAAEPTQPVAQPAPSSSQAYAPAPPPRQPIVRLHIVRRSETLAVIAHLYGVSVTEIKRWNGIKRDTIYAGQRLVIFIHK